MTQEEIIDSNKMIAEFMGENQLIDNTLGFTYWTFDEKLTEIIDDLMLGPNWVGGNFKFHKSWSWLMPVVEKIETFIFENDEYYNFNILGGCYVTIISSHGNELVTSDEGQSKLECVWLAVIEFIKWYNENK